MKPVTRLLATSSLVALAGCGTLSGVFDNSSSYEEGYEPVSRTKDGTSTVTTLRNGCIVTETITQEPNLYRYHGEMKCPWDADKAEP